MKRTFIFLIFLYLVSSQLRFITKTTPAMIGLLNTTTGKSSVISELQFPNECENAIWNIGDGTRGQTSTVFYQNGTWFMLAQQKCEMKNEISLIAIIGPYPTRYNATVRQIELASYVRSYNIDNVTEYFSEPKLTEFSVNWDWTCNVQVTGPFEQGDSLQFPTLQVSYYDGQIRQQADLTSEEIGCQNCWRRVYGASALDHVYSPEVQDPMEINCGDKCALLTVEENVVEGKVQLPNRIIGRSFRTAEELYIISDTVPVKTMTYNRFTKTFFGLAECCTDEWCSDDCSGHEGEIVLVELSSAQKEPVIVHIFQEPCETKDDTIRIGIEVDNRQYHPKQFGLIYVYYNNKILTLKTDATLSPVSLLGHSQELEQTPKLWALTQF